MLGLAWRPGFTVNGAASKKSPRCLGRLSCAALLALAWALPIGNHAAIAAKLGADAPASKSESEIDRQSERNRSRQSASDGRSQSARQRFAWEISRGVGALWTSRVDLRRDATPELRLAALKVWIQAGKENEPSNLPEGLRENRLQIGDEVLRILEAAANRDELLLLAFSTDFRSTWEVMSTATRDRAYRLVRDALASFSGDQPGALAFMERLAGMPFVPAKVDYLIDGPQAIERFSRDLRDSAGTFHLAVFELSALSATPSPDDVAWALVDALREKVKRGDRVYVYFDQVGLFGFFDDARRARGQAVVDALHRANVDVVIRAPPLLPTELDHRKLATMRVGPKRVPTTYLGSQNIGCNYQGPYPPVGTEAPPTGTLAQRCPPPNDNTNLKQQQQQPQRQQQQQQQQQPWSVGDVPTSVTVNGVPARSIVWHDAVAAIQSGPVFERVRALIEQQRLAAGGSPSEMNPVGEHPFDGPGVVPTLIGEHVPGEDDRTKALLLVALASLSPGQKAFVATPYFTDEHFVATLAHLADRGVDVSLVLPGNNDVFIAKEAARGFYERLIGAGVKVFEYPGMSHLKVLIAGDIVVFGSSNLDGRSLENFEVLAVVHDKAFALDLRTRLFDVDIALSRRIFEHDTTLLQALFAALGDVL